VSRNYARLDPGNTNYMGAYVSINGSSFGGTYALVRKMSIVAEYQYKAIA
jgi:hypothetical protein